MNFFKNKKETLTKEPIVVTIVKGDSVIHRMITEADIRTEAYFLWEKNGKIGSSEEYWYQAEKNILKLLNEK